MRHKRRRNVRHGKMASPNSSFEVVSTSRLHGFEQVAFFVFPLRLELWLRMIAYPAVIRTAMHLKTTLPLEDVPLDVVPHVEQAQVNMQADSVPWTK